MTQERFSNLTVLNSHKKRTAKFAPPPPTAAPIQKRWSPDPALKSDFMLIPRIGVQDEKIEIPQTLSHQSPLETILENTRLSSFDFIFSKITNFLNFHLWEAFKPPKKCAWYPVVTCFHPPNWHFPLSGSHKTFHFSYRKFFFLLTFLFIKVSVSSTFKEKKKVARIGFDLGASALQCITLTPTPPRICWQWMVWFEYI